jgi:hypothetical protein
MHCFFRFHTARMGVKRLFLTQTLLLFAVGWLGLVACRPAVEPDPQEDNPTESASSAPGFGASKARPEGTPFVFPTGISLVKKPGFDGDCLFQARKEKKIRGAGGVVALCLQFSNANDQPVRVQLPPGLIWVAEKNEILQDISQNGILVKTVTVLVPAHATELVWLTLCCLNFDRSGPRLGDTFEAQPLVSNHPGLKPLLQQLSTKKINEEEYATLPTDAERLQLAAVQLAVNDVQKYGRVQPNTQALVDVLPTVK